MNESEFDQEMHDIEVLLESQAKQILLDYGIPTTRYMEVDDIEAAVQAADAIGYPVVLKVLSTKVVHKTDAGGVFLDLMDAEMVRWAFRKLMDRVRPIDPDVRSIVQEMISPGVEVIVGTTTDPHFGATLMVGIGGIFTELLEDVAFGLIPIDPEHAWRMLRSLKGFPLLQGYREKQKVDLEPLVRIMLNISRLVVENPNIVELDLNPVIVHEKSAIAVDARIAKRNSPIADQFS